MAGCAWCLSMARLWGGGGGGGGEGQLIGGWQNGGGRVEQCISLSLLPCPICMKAWDHLYMPSVLLSTQYIKLVS